MHLDWFSLRSDRKGLGAARVTGGAMPSAYHVHPEFGYFCPTPHRRRELRVAIVSVLFGAIIGGSIATLRAGHDRNPDGTSTAAHVDVSNSESVLVAAAEATPAATNDADTK